MKMINADQLDVWTEDSQLDMVKFNQWLKTIDGEKIELKFTQKEYYLKQTDEDNSFFHFDNVHHLTIDGQGSTFTFGEVGHYFKMTQCTGIILKNLNLDWDWNQYPLASVGIVQTVEENGTYIDVEFPQWKQVDANMKIKMVGPLDPKTFAPGIERGVEFRPFVNPHIPEYIRQSDSKELKAMIRELEERFIGVEVVKEQTIRFYMKDEMWTKQWMEPGQAYHFRHYEYDTVGVLVEGSQEIFFDHVTMYSCPGSGFVLRNDVKTFGFDHCQIVLKPGTDRTITTTADGIHIANTQGDFYVKNCIFSRSGDDCINFHDNTLMGFQIITKDTISFANINLNGTPIMIGDELEFRNVDLSPTGIKNKVNYVNVDEAKNTCIVSFENEFNQLLKEDMIVWNGRFCTGNFHIQNNLFFENRARAILVHGSNGIIENNRFFHIQGSAIQIETGAEVRWAEGKGVEHVTIRNNYFQSCDINGWNMATIYIGVYLPNGRTAFPIFKDIEIRENTFIDGPRQAIFISSAENVKVVGNSIRNYMQRDIKENSYGSSQIEAPVYGEEYSGVIQHMLSKQVEISHLF